MKPSYAAQGAGAQLEPERQAERRSEERPLPHGQSETEAVRTELTLQPPCDIFETPERIVLLADLPGVTREGLDITVHRGRLTIQGRVSIPRPDGRIPGRYQRIFQLTEVVDEAHFSAELRDGVLRLEMPKRPEFQPHRVTIAVREPEPTQREAAGDGGSGSGEADGPAGGA